MANTIILKKSSVAAKVPLATDLAVGELAVNLADKKLYSKDAGGTVVELGGGSGSGDVVGPSSATDNAIARFDGMTGKLIQNSIAKIDDDGSLNITSPDGYGSAYFGGFIGGSIVLGVTGGDNAYVSSDASGTSLQGAPNAELYISVSGAPATLSGALARLLSSAGGFTVNAAGAYGIGATPAYGTAGQALLSGGNAAEPTWGAVLKPADIGVSVQAYDAELTSWAGIAPSAKQDTLVSGTSIKTINSTSLLGSGNIVITGEPTVIDSPFTGSSSHTVTGIPSTASLILISLYADAGTSSTLSLRLGTSGGIDASGSYVRSTYTGGVYSGTATSFLLAGPSGKYVTSGHIELRLNDAATNLWTFSANLHWPISPFVCNPAGYKALSAALSQIQLLSSSGWTGRIVVNYW